MINMAGSSNFDNKKSFIWCQMWSSNPLETIMNLEGKCQPVIKCTAKVFIKAVEKNKE